MVPPLVPKSKELPMRKFANFVARGAILGGAKIW